MDLLQLLHGLAIFEEGDASLLGQPSEFGAGNREAIADNF